MCCSKLNYINNVIVYDARNGNGGDVANDDDGDDDFNGHCRDQNDGYDIFFIYF